VKSEKWDPYCRWTRSLGADDTVITFNYDRVLEFTEPPKATVIIDDESFKRAARLQHCRIFKLHGSVDWKKTPDGIVPTKDPLFALKCDAGEIAIATPGPTKADHSDTKPLDGLWSIAMESISAADRVVFVGYRFPPTDAIARQRILDAIRGASRQLECRVVLGQSTNDEQRINGLLQFALQAREGWPGRVVQGAVYVEPMFAEDFFGVVRRDLL